MLEIKNLHASVDGKDILEGHQLNGQGRAKCMRSWARTGRVKALCLMCWQVRDGYEITQGSEVIFKDEDLLDVGSGRAGTPWCVSLAFQYPVEIPGVSNIYLLKAAVNAVREHQGLDELDAMDFLDVSEGEVKCSWFIWMRSFYTAALTKVSRAVRRNAMKSCKWPCWSQHLAILDETDSGLGYRCVANGIRRGECTDVRKNVRL